MSLHCIYFTVFYSYTQTYNNNVSQSISLQKLAVLPFLNVKPLVYLNKSYTNMFYRRGYGLKENDILYTYFFTRGTYLHEVVLADWNLSLFTFPRQRTDESFDKFNVNKSFFILFFDYPKNCCTFIKV